MKRRLIPGLMLIAAFTLTNCSEQLAPPVVEENVILGETMVVPEDAVRTPYEIFVEGNETKTISNGESVYWVSEASAVANKMDRSAVDKIRLFSISSTNGSSYTTHGEFEYVGNQTFSGNLNGSFEALPNSNNWLCLYPSSSVCSSSEATTNAAAAVSAKVNIGTSTLPGIARDSKSHIAGINYPMYGIKNNVPKDKTPKFKMSHLYALVALEIVNVGDGKADNDDQPITVNSVTFTAPDNIIGDFNVNVTNDKHIFTDATDATNHSKTISLTALKDTEGETGITIDPRESATLYFAIKPYDASGKELKISINGSEKTVKMPANTKFEEGKITTLKVPIKLSHPKESDALSYITFHKNTSRKEIIINGEKINAYVLHQSEQWVDWKKQMVGHTLTIKGNVKELFNLLDAGFYASTWDGLPSAMTVSNINLWISGTQFIKYDPLMTSLRSNLANQPGLGQLVAALWDIPLVGPKALIGNMFEDGIGRDGELSLTRFIDPSTITFIGLVSNGANANNPNIFMLDDGTIHKLVGKGNIENLLSTKFDYETTLGEKLIPSYSGLLEIINHSQGMPYSPEAYKTIRAIYGKLKSTMSTFGADFGGITIKAWDIFEALFPDEEKMMEILPSITVSVTIQVYPYSSAKGAYGTKGAPVKPNIALQPIILWGFDTKTTENPTGL